MAGYGYTNRPGYNSYQGIEQTGYNNDYGSSDHLCRPVIVDADGRKRPIISYNNPNNSEGYVIKTERIVEHVQTPGMASEYKYGSPTFVERPQRVQEYITKVQTELTRPATSGPLSSTYWHNTPNSAGYNGATGYNENSNYKNNDWNKPSGNTIRDDRFDDYHRNKPSGNTIRDDRFDDYYRRNESPMGPKGWSTTTPPSHETALSNPTNNIGAAVEFLKEAAMSSAVNAVVPPQARFMLPSSIVPKRDTYVETPKRDSYVETIDNKEAARRYGNLNLASRLMKTAETYTGTIDSNEAARKYKGSRV